MKDADAQLLMRFYDGECSPAEEDAAGRLIREEPEAMPWLDALAAQQERFENLPPVLSELAIEQDWQSLKEQLAPTATPSQPKKSNLVWPRFWTASAAAAIILFAAIAFLLPGNDATAQAVTPNIVDSVETDIEGATPIIYVDQESGWSVVWVDEAAATAS
ncbi:hypothetical protein [Cerasicoccus maritimus]|uniref:hypothetical protein n=1 Tax=Cerasicoccus maritimus TaxID=490089 RepID=UPI002852D4E1|nr:hypothetical protein [Cerasicoccus maritimus]